MVIPRPETVERRRPLMTPKPLTPSTRIAAYRCRVWRSPNSRLGGCQEKAGPNVVGHLQWGNPGWKWGTPVDSASSATGRPDELQMFKCWSFLVRTIGFGVPQFGETPWNKMNGTWYMKWLRGCESTWKPTCQPSAVLFLMSFDDTCLVAAVDWGHGHVEGPNPHHEGLATARFSLWDGSPQPVYFYPPWCFGLVVETKLQSLVLGYPQGKSQR